MAARTFFFLQLLIKAKGQTNVQRLRYIFTKVNRTVSRIATVALNEWNSIARMKIPSHMDQKK